MKDNRVIEANGIKTFNASLTTCNPRDVFAKSYAGEHDKGRFFKDDGTPKQRPRLSEEEKIRIRELSKLGMTEAKVALEVSRSTGSAHKYKNYGEEETNKPKKRAAKQNKRLGRKPIGENEIMGMIFNRYTLNLSVNEIAVGFRRAPATVSKYTKATSIYVVESGILTH